MTPNSAVNRTRRLSGPMNLRSAQPADFPSVLALNEASVRFLSPLSPERLAALDREATLHVVIELAGGVVAFLLAFREHANYDSVNYQWFELRYPSFLYIDRVVVGQDARTNGAGSLLYKQAFAHAVEAGIPILACEFDVDPPNPVSERFHARFGFREAGRQSVANGSKRVSLQIAAAGAPHGA
jgi:predicted GNAT superfamily acetyltransferase